VPSICKTCIAAMTAPRVVPEGQSMQALSIPQDASLEAPAQAARTLRHTRTAEEEARANFDAVFEFACRFIIIRSLPGWVEEIRTEPCGLPVPLRLGGACAFMTSLAQSGESCADDKRQRRGIGLFSQLF
jgi:hypothetical protein